MVLREGKVKGFSVTPNMKGKKVGEKKNDFFCIFVSEKDQSILKYLLTPACSEKTIII